MNELSLCGGSVTQSLVIDLLLFLLLFVLEGGVNIVTFQSRLTQSVIRKKTANVHFTTIRCEPNMANSLLTTLCMLGLKFL